MLNEVLVVLYESEAETVTVWFPRFERVGVPLIDKTTPEILQVKKVGEIPIFFKWFK